MNNISYSNISKENHFFFFQKNYNSWINIPFAEKITIKSYSFLDKEIDFICIRRRKIQCSIWCSAFARMLWKEINKNLERFKQFTLVQVSAQLTSDSNAIIINAHWLNNTTSNHLLTWTYFIRQNKNQEKLSHSTISI